MLGSGRRAHLFRPSTGLSAVYGLRVTQPVYVDICPRAERRGLIGPPDPTHVVEGFGPGPDPTGSVEAPEERVAQDVDGHGQGVHRGAVERQAVLKALRHKDRGSEEGLQV